jgi:hypothetical protein
MERGDAVEGRSEHSRVAERVGADPPPSLQKSKQHAGGHRRPRLAAGGDAMNSMVCYGFLGYLLVRRADEPTRRTVIVASAALLIGVIGFSRLYLGSTI